MVFFSKKSFVGNFRLSFSKILKRNCEEVTELLIISIFQETRINRNEKITIMNILENTLKSVR